jgi:hypothetical protein
MRVRESVEDLESRCACRESTIGKSLGAGRGIPLRIL